MSRGKGFTLIELLIVIVIIGVLMAYGIPNYQRYVIISKRTEAKTVIMQIAAEQEKHNATYTSYTTSLTLAGASGLGFDATREPLLSKNYIFSVTNTNGYTITAAAKGNTQINDNIGADCTSLTLNSLGVKLPLDCWQ